MTLEFWLLEILRLTFAFGVAGGRLVLVLVHGVRGHLLIKTSEPGIPS
jgi:hypothetical protein